MTTPFEKLAGVTLEGDDLADLPEVTESLRALVRVPVTFTPTGEVDEFEHVYALSEDEFEARLARLATRR